MALNITEGKIQRPLKVVIYGTEGIGKTTLASKFPNPLFIDTEGGTAHLDVRRVERPASWDDLLRTIIEISRSNECKTLILDTADWAEQMCVYHVCTVYKQKSIESFGYGKGYVYVLEEFQELIKTLDICVERGKNVVVTAHAKMRKFEQPDEAGAYDRWEMKLSKHVAPLLKEWCDILLFLNYKTYVVTTDSNTKKVQGGKRIMYTSHNPCWDAKNRQGLPEEMDMDYANIAHLFTENQIEPHLQLKKLHQMMEQHDVTAEEIKKVMDRNGHHKDKTVDEYPEEFIQGYIFKYWDALVKIIKNERKEK